MRFTFDAFRVWKNFPYTLIRGKKKSFVGLSGCRAGSSRSRVFFFVEKRRDREQGGEGLGEGERKRGRGGERERERRPSKAGEENERELVERVPW